MYCDFMKFISADFGEVLLTLLFYSIDSLTNIIGFSSAVNPMYSVFCS